MRTEKLNYYLPPELIAQQPCDIRGRSRLFIFNRIENEFLDCKFTDLPVFLKQGDCLVINDTKVLPARFFVQRKTGANLEALFLKEQLAGCWEVMLKGIRKLKTGEVLCLKDKSQKNFCKATLLEKKEQGKCILKLETDQSAQDILEQIGMAPLPPYIKRTDCDLKQTKFDKQRYQTIYASNPGAIAAPTAGLHFTNKLIEKLKQQGILFAYLTLHVGAGTFKPIKTEDLEEHQIHTESFSINKKNTGIINTAKENGGRIIAVGTTSVRTLETIARGSKVQQARGQTQLFIKPGYCFKIVDAMITNFHLPKSTLLALVAAFAGLEKTITAYQHAIEKKYRFYSYGDAMMII